MDILESHDIDMIVSLPCDKNKGFTDAIHERFKVIDVTREEDAVGICAGSFLCGRRPVVSIQSSGIGNMLNAMMSLTACYGLPMVILASWRGMEDERIEAQVPFNSRIPELLGVYGIGCNVVGTTEDLPAIGEAIEDSFDNGRINVILIRPTFWGTSERSFFEYPSRARRFQVRVDDIIPRPSMTRLEAIKAVMSSIWSEDIVVSNIGVPSKEVYATSDRPLNFYMLGSYTQATPIGLGMALSVDRRVIVIDGDGSLLGSSILPVLVSEYPTNLIVVCLDNGTFGSTGNQINQAYRDVDLGAVARAYGIEDVVTVSDPDSLSVAIDHVARFRFVHAIIVPFNSKSPNIPYRAAEIRDRFMAALKK